MFPKQQYLLLVLSVLVGLGLCGPAAACTVTIEMCAENFLPKGGTEDNTTTIRAFVTPDSIKGRFKFTLYDVSDEPGYCRNGPANAPAPWQEDSDDWKDLQFPAQTGFTISGLENEIAETTANDLSEATVTVKSFDYGSYGKIKVEFTTQDGSQTWVGKEAGGAKQYTNVPRDTDEDHLADKWENDEVTAWNTQYGESQSGLAFFAAASNKEKKDPDGANTDGGVDLKDHKAVADPFTAYREYRGYIGTDNTDKTKHRRLSAARKELLVEVDIMDQKSGTPGGKMTGTTDAKTATTITDNDAGWTAGQLVGLKLNPDTSQSLRFIITANTATVITVYGDISIATDLEADSTYQISKSTPPTSAMVANVMSDVAGTAGQKGYLGTAGVQIYYIIDDTSGARVPWSSIGSEELMTNWMIDCKDEGAAGEDNYSDFTHIAFCDYLGNKPFVDGATDPDCGGVVLCFVDEEQVKNFGGSGISNRQAYAATAMHEIGESVGCDDNANLENAFKIKYVGAEASATLNKAAANPAFVAAYLKTTVGGAPDLDYNLRSTSYDTLQELVNDVNPKADYDATLDGTAAQTSILLKDYTGLSLPKNTDVQLKNYNDDHIMFTGFSPDRSTNLKFHQTWAKSIPDMDVANHY